jgi:salicylate hydroxylase
MPSQKQRLQVAVIGAGPGGLAAAIHLLRQPLVSVQVFDKARELREVGAVSWAGMIPRQ